MRQLTKRDYWVYILSNQSRMLYVGVTNDLERRLAEHRARLTSGFAERYGLTRLVYFESTGDVQAAIAREKQLKSWVRRKKVALVHSVNPEWKDLSEDWAPPVPEILRSAQDDKGGDQDDTRGASGDGEERRMTGRSTLACGALRSNLA